jgi:hypothetical protein
MEEKRCVGGVSADAFGVQNELQANTFGPNLRGHMERQWFALKSSHLYQSNFVRV